MFTSECCTFCTILHITFLSIERYIAVCWPIAARTLVTRRRTRVLIGCLWLGAAVSAAPVLVMVGVEEVVGEDPGFGKWKDNRVWTGVEGSELKLGGFMLGDGAGGSGGLFSIDSGLDGMKWTESIDEKLRLVEEEKANLETEEREEIKQTNGENTRDTEGGVEEEKFEAKRLQHRREREEENAKGGLDLPDNRECRTTSYAISSGLLSTMTIVSNMYFLLPVCILGLLYSLIGRTLWLRPQSSRREQSHRHTVKMLGVIVLAFVLCWLPFHVGRTIFTLSQGSSGDGQEANPKTKTHIVMNSLSGSTGRDRYTQTETKTNTNTSTQSEDINTKSHLYSHTTLHTRATGATHSKTQNSSVSTYTYKPSFTPGHTLTEQRNTTICQNSQTELYNDTSFNNTHAHYYLYCFSQYFNLLTSVLFYLSAAVNPLLYNLMSARYKHAVHSLLHAHAHLQTHRRRTLTGQHSTTTTL